MKNFCYLVLAAISLIAAASCEDIVKSEDNIDKNQIQYNYILQDQEHGVIMPLKAGNTWYYNLTFFDSLIRLHILFPIPLFFFMIQQSMETNGL